MPMSANAVVRSSDEEVEVSDELLELELEVELELVE